MNLVQSQRFAHPAGNRFAVTGEHHGADSGGPQPVNGGFGVLLDLIRNEHRTQEHAVPRHIHDGSHAVVGAVVNALRLHHPGVAGQHGMTVHPGADALTGNLPGVGGPAGVQSAGGFPQTFADGMAGKALRQRGLFQKFLPADARRRADLRHRKGALGQGAGLVKNHRVNVGQAFQIVAALDQNAAAGRPANAAKEAQGNADDQRAGAADDQERQRTADPFPPATAQHQRRQNRQHQRAKADGRGVIVGEPGDEILRPGLFQAGILHHIKNFGHGGLPVQLGGAQAQQSFAVDAAADDLLPGTHIPGLALAGQRRSVEGAFALHHDPVNGHLLPGPDHQHGAHRHIVGVHRFHRAVGPLQIGAVRPDVHQITDALAALAHGVALEQFAHLIEQHDRDGLAVFTQGQGAHSGHRHQEVFVKHFAVYNAQHRFAQHIVADDQIRHQENGKVCQTGQRHHTGQNGRSQIQRRCNQNASEGLFLLFCHHGSSSFWQHDKRKGGTRRPGLFAGPANGRRSGCLCSFGDISAVRSLPLQFNLKIRFHAPGSLDGGLQNLVKLVVLGVQHHFLRHKTHRGAVHAGQLLDGLFDLGRAVGAVHFNFEFFLHEGTLLIHQS